MNIPISSPLATPPPPPPMERKVCWKSALPQLVILFLLPLMSLLGFFDKKMAERTHQSPQLLWKIIYPIKTRPNMNHIIKVQLHNKSSTVQGPILVYWDKKYLESSFSNLQFLPEPRIITSEYFISEVPSLAPGETRDLMVELKVDTKHLGRTTGLVRVEREGKKEGEHLMRTFILP